MCNSDKYQLSLSFLELPLPTHEVCHFKKMYNIYCHIRTTSLASRCCGIMHTAYVGGSRWEKVVLVHN